MKEQSIFRRYELKYLISPEQMQAVMQAMQPHMVPDPYGQTTIRNIYFDTPNYRLIRRSLEKPAYKEKLRLRSYRQSQEDDRVFVELKKKYQGVVYKRRLSLGCDSAMAWLCSGDPCGEDSQIVREVDYFLSFYDDLRPSMFLSYDRQAFFAGDGSDFRVTFDRNILARQTMLYLGAPVYGTPLLPEGKVLMELKCPGSMPLWMAQTLSRESIFQTSFSKYGVAYASLILANMQEVS